MCIARFAVSQIQDACVCVCLLDDAINVVALALPDREWKEVSVAALLVLVLVTHSSSGIVSERVLRKGVTAF